MQMIQWPQEPPEQEAVQMPKAMSVDKEPIHISKDELDVMVSNSSVLSGNVHYYCLTCVVSGLQIKKALIKKAIQGHVSPPPPQPQQTTSAVSIMYHLVKSALFVLLNVTIL